MLFDRSSPPPFFQAQLSPGQRHALDVLFIGPRSQAHYLKRFASFDAAQRIGMRWHWAAFFMTLPWLLYRKRYLDGLVYAVAGWSFVQLVLTLMLVITETVLMPFVPPALGWWVRGSVAGAGLLGWCVLTAGWADAYYYRVARREISETLEDRLSQGEQAAHLQQEGGVSWVGGLVAVLLFGFLLLLVRYRFLPMYATYQSREALLMAYDAALVARGRVDTIYQASGVCPAGLPLSTAEQNQHLASIAVQRQADGLPPQTQCVVVATLRGIRWPAQSINGEQVVLYRLPDQRWHCLTTISSREAPRRCQLEE